MNIEKKKCCEKKYKLNISNWFLAYKIFIAFQKSIFEHFKQSYNLLQTTNIFSF